METPTHNSREAAAFRAMDLDDRRKNHRNSAIEIGGVSAGATAVIYGLENQFRNDAINSQGYADADIATMQERVDSGVTAFVDSEGNVELNENSSEFTAVRDQTFEEFTAIEEQAVVRQEELADTAEVLSVGTGILAIAALGLAAQLERRRRKAEKKRGFKV